MRANPAAPRAAGETESDAALLGGVVDSLVAYVGDLRLEDTRTSNAAADAVGQEIAGVRALAAELPALRARLAAVEGDAARLDALLARAAVLFWDGENERYYALHDRAEIDRYLDAARGGETGP
jgi:hypothetical protein